MMKVGPGCKVEQQLHVILRYIEGMANMQFQEFRGMADIDFKLPLNKSMRHMDNSDNIDLIMIIEKILQHRRHQQTLHRDWKNNQLEE